MRVPSTPLQPTASDPVHVTDNLPEPWHPWLGDLEWSPDGSEILLKGFTYRVPLDGSPPIASPLTFIDRDGNSQVETPMDAAWSPDGSTLAVRIDEWHKWHSGGPSISADSSWYSSLIGTTRTSAHLWRFSCKTRRLYKSHFPKLRSGSPNEESAGDRNPSPEVAPPNYHPRPPCHPVPQRSRGPSRIPREGGGPRPPQAISRIPPRHIHPHRHSRPHPSFPRTRESETRNATAPTSATAKNTRGCLSDP